MNNTRIAFFGTSDFSVFCLEEMKKLGILPAVIITTPDKPQGRKLIMEANPVKTWATENNIKFLTPNKLDSDFTSHLTPYTCNLFLVASYGKIIPKVILDMPKYGVLNIHPSLLPKYRGPSPLQEQILNDEKNIGVTVMLMDEQVDHGPIIAQEKIDIPNWPVNFLELEKITAEAGIKLFAKILPDWTDGKIKPQTQDHNQVTFTKKIEKTDGELDIVNGDPYKNYLKTKAYYPWPGTFFFISRPSPSLDKEGLGAVEKKRVIIKESEYVNGEFHILKVLPEGKKEMSYDDFLRGLK